MTSKSPANAAYRLYEGGIRVPFFLRWPARLEPRKVDTIAAHIDIVPTILEAAGAALPAGVQVDGRSLMPLLEGGAKGWPERTFYIRSHRGDEPQRYRAFAAVSQRWKLVQALSFGQSPPADAPLELYDSEADPGEQHNLVDAHPDVVAHMKRSYEQWFQDVSSTRGYAPPKIYLGTKHENPVWLTRQTGASSATTIGARAALAIGRSMCVRPGATSVAWSEVDHC